jgi:FkbM family methyltransferase
VNPSYKVKRVHGVWLPQEEEHLLQFLENTDQHINGIGTYQLDKLRTAIRFVKNRGMAVDVGAHAGLWSMWLGHVFRKLISIEPVPSSFYTMIKNVEPLLAEGTVHEAHQYAVGPEKKLVWMRLLDGDRNSTGSYFAVDEPRDGDIPVEMHRLDDLIPYDPIDFLKIDVQGGEAGVVRGAEKLIKRTWPVICIEARPYLAQEDAIELLGSWGYKIRQSLFGDYIMTVGE